MTFDWKGWIRRAEHALAGVVVLAVAAWALGLWAPLRTLWSFANVSSGSSTEIHPGVARVLPPTPVAPATGRHAWKAKPRPKDTPQVPVLEPQRKADLDRLNKKLDAAEVEIGKTHDLIASAQLPDGKDLFTVAPRDGGPATTVVYEPRFHLGGRVSLVGDGLLDFNFKGKIAAADVALLADLVRAGRLQLRGGPAAFYDPLGGTHAGALVRLELCLVHC